MSSTPPKIVRCPSCGEDSVYAESNPHRPFCSARCRGIDLVHWAEGEYKIPVQSRSDQTTHSTDENATEDNDYED